MNNNSNIKDLNSFQCDSLFRGSAEAIKEKCFSIIDILDCDNETYREAEYTEEDASILKIGINDIIEKMLDEIREYNKLNRESKIQLESF